MKPLPSVYSDIHKCTGGGFLNKCADNFQHGTEEPYHDGFSQQDKDAAIRQSDTVFLCLPDSNSSEIFA